MGRGRPVKPKITKRTIMAEGQPPCPKWIRNDPEYSAAWDQACADLESIGLLSKTDSAILAVFVQAGGEFEKLDSDVRENGVTAISAKGLAMQRPEVGARNKAAERLMKAAIQLGLTPGARTRIDTSEGDDADIFGQYLNVKRAQNKTAKKTKKQVG